MLKKQKQLKPRPDGAVNVTLSPDVVKVLDEMIAPLGETFGFKPTRSQGLRYLLKQLEHLYGDGAPPRSGGFGG